MSHQNPQKSDFILAHNVLRSSFYKGDIVEVLPSLGEKPPLFGIICQQRNGLLKKGECLILSPSKLER